MFEPEGPSRDLERLYRTEFWAVVHAAFVVCGSHHRAVELAQEAFVVAFVSWRRVSALDRPGAWVRRVAINLAIKDRSREARSETRDPYERDLHRAESGDQAVVDRHALRDAIDSLPTNQRLAIVLTYFHDLPNHEVAATLGCAEATVRVHLHRARDALRKRLASTWAPLGDL